MKMFAWQAALPASQGFKLGVSTGIARVPRPILAAVAAVQPFGVVLVVAGAEARLDVDLHQALGYELHIWVESDGSLS